MSVINNQDSLKNLVSMELLLDDEVMGLITRGHQFKQGKVKIEDNNDIFATNLFFENSTRTHKSFEVSERKLGLPVIDFNSDTSSVNKGETLYDTVLTMSALGIEICVIRHPEVDYYNN